MIGSEFLPFRADYYFQFLESIGPECLQDLKVESNLQTYDSLIDHRKLDLYRAIRIPRHPLPVLIQQSLPSISKREAAYTLFFSLSTAVTKSKKRKKKKNLYSCAHYQRDFGE